MARIFWDTNLFIYLLAAATDLFVTNDSRLSHLVVSGITFITGVGRWPY